MMERIQELNGTRYDGSILTDLLPEIGCPVESNNDEEIEIEVFPDRPDLLSHETMAKAIRSFTGVESPDSAISVSQGQLKIGVDETLEDIRPVIMGAIVRSVSTGESAHERDAFIQSLMDHQEKLHMTLGEREHYHQLEYMIFQSSALLSDMFQLLESSRSGHWHQKAK